MDTQKLAVKLSLQWLSWTHTHTHLGTHCQKTPVADLIGSSLPPPRSSSCKAFSTPWQAAGFAAATSRHYADYHPCLSHAPPPKGRHGEPISEGADLTEGKKFKEQRKEVDIHARQRGCV